MDCCSDKTCEVQALYGRQRTTLRLVLAINGVMFVLEMSAGLAANSAGLMADSLDMLGDALVYGFSLLVVARGPHWKAVAALAKGVIMAAFGLFVLGQVAYNILIPHLPTAQIIGAVGVIALIANATCLMLLWRHRTEDINMRSVWLCSRNDILANISVILAGLAVGIFGSRWPDVLVGLAIAGLFLSSSLYVLREAVAGLRTTSDTVLQPPRRG